MPSPFLPGRLRELRAEQGLSQAELADKIGSDARQVSRYENGRVAPFPAAATGELEAFPALGIGPFAPSGTRTTSPLDLAMKLTPREACPASSAAKQGRQMHVG